jgi:hypothetical protein
VTCAKMNLGELWSSNDALEWRQALEAYWDRVPERRRSLEERMERLSPVEVGACDASSWVQFLHEEYFVWKYTQGNRLANSRRLLDRQVQEAGFGYLDSIRMRLLSIEPGDIGRAIHVAGLVKGLGVAGASGLLSLLYPAHFGTLDRFLVLNLRSVEPEVPELHEMNPDGLTGLDGVILTSMLRAKAMELTSALGESWTPRKIDKVLWTTRPLGT